jgi:hypothetical protein
MCVKKHFLPSPYHPAPLFFDDSFWMILQNLLLAATLSTPKSENLLNPVLIRIQQERHSLHPPIGKTFLPVNLQILKPLASVLQAIDADTQMSKALRLRVSIMVLEVGVLLGTIIPRQLDQLRHIN